MYRRLGLAMVLSSLSQNQEPSELSVHLYFVSGSDTYLLTAHKKEVSGEERNAKRDVAPWVAAFFPQDEVDDPFDGDVVAFLRLTETLLFDARDGLSAL